MPSSSAAGRAFLAGTFSTNSAEALAADRSFVGWATSAQPRDAQQEAVAQCTQNGGQNCMLHPFSSAPIEGSKFHTPGGVRS